MRNKDDRRLSGAPSTSGPVCCPPAHPLNHSRKYSMVIRYHSCRSQTPPLHPSTRHGLRPPKWACTTILPINHHRALHWDRGRARLVRRHIPRPVAPLAWSDGCTLHKLNHAASRCSSRTSSATYAVQRSPSQWCTCGAHGMPTPTDTLHIRSYTPPLGVSWDCLAGRQVRRSSETSMHAAARCSIQCSSHSLMTRGDIILK